MKNKIQSEYSDLEVLTLSIIDILIKLFDTDTGNSQLKILLGLKQINDTEILTNLDLQNNHYLNKYLLQHL